LIGTIRPFTFAVLEDDLKFLLDSGYEFIRCVDYMTHNYKPGKKIVLRIDVDKEPRNLIAIIAVLARLNIKASFFFRIHAASYNIFSSHYYTIIRSMIKGGHEIGLHSEILDFCHVADEEPSKAMRKDISIFQEIFGLTAVGISSHGDISGINNLEFWGGTTATELGALYEAYDDNCLNLFKNSLYVSDSEWIHWKTYTKGVLNVERSKRLREVFLDNPELGYILFHPETFFKTHPFEID